MIVATTQKPVNNVKAGKPCSYGHCTSGCRKCAHGLTCRRKAFHYGDSSGSSVGVCAPTNCKDCTKAHGTWMSNKCTFGAPGVADGVMFTTPKQCDHYEATKKAHCSRYHDCKSCVSKGMHKTLGALCGWSAGFAGAGSCQTNNGGNFMPLFVNAKQCPKPIVVKGRE